MFFAEDTSPGVSARRGPWTSGGVYGAQEGWTRLGIAPHTCLVRAKRPGSKPAGIPAQAEVGVAFERIGELAAAAREQGAVAVRRRKFVCSERAGEGSEAEACKNAAGRRSARPVRDLRGYAARGHGFCSFSKIRPRSARVTLRRRTVSPAGLDGDAFRRASVRARRRSAPAACPPRARALALLCW